ncbi:MAG TPA: hypothetical protein VD971_03835 [Phycisphaerales bacterium]|nr:hypothetical protein [Phycisphaerales bacterium]
MNRRRVLPVLCAATMLAGLAGCYERVVASRGVGGSSVQVQKPYRSDTRLDRAVDGLLGRKQSGDSLRIINQTPGK